MLGHRRHSAAEYLEIWRRRRHWALLCLLLGLAAGYALARMLPAKFTSTAVLEVAGPFEPGSGNDQGPEVSGPQLSSIEERYLTEQRLRDLAARSGIYPPPGGGKDWGANSFAEMRKDIVLAPSPRGFELSFTAGNASVAQQVCAGLAALFTEEGGRNPGQQAAEANSPGPSPAGSSAGEPLAREVQEAKRKLDDAEGKLAAFQRRHPGEPSGEDEQSAQSSLMGYNLQLEAVEAALKRAQQDKTALADSILVLQSAPAPSPKAAETPATQALEQELAAKQAELVTLRARYTPDHPDVVKLRSDIAQLQKKIDEARAAAGPKKPDTVPAPEPPQLALMRAQVAELDRTIQEKTAEQARLQGEIQAARARLQNGALLAQELRRLTRDRDAAQAAYNTLLAKQADARKSMQTESRPEQRAQFRLAEPANLPALPSFPNPILFALGGAGGGFGLGLIVVVLGELRDKTLRTEGDIEHFLDLPTLAVIPPAEGPSGKDSSSRGSSRSAGNASGEKEESVLAGV